jgi:hypothetical protein
MCCWPLPAQSFSGPSPLGFETIFYCLRFETSLFVASYGSQGHGGGIRPRLHTCSFIHSLEWFVCCNLHILCHGNACSPNRCPAKVYSDFQASCHNIVNGGTTDTVLNKARPKSVCTYCASVPNVIFIFTRANFGKFKKTCKHCRNDFTETRRSKRRWSLGNRLHPAYAVNVCHALRHPACAEVKNAVIMVI